MSGSTSPDQIDPTVAEVLTQAPWRTAPPASPLVGFWASVLSRLGRILVSKTMTFVLAAIALAVGLSTFIILARGSPLGLEAGTGTALVLGNITVLLLLGAVLAGRLTRVWVERRRGSAGSQLHVRLVLLFSGVAIAPTILVACFAAVFFHFGIQAWFNDPVRDALAESAAGLARLPPEEHLAIRSAPMLWKWPTIWPTRANISPLTRPCS